MIDTEIEQYPNYMSGYFTELVDMNRPLTKKPKNILVSTVDDIWLIKVNKDRCPVCGTVEKSRLDWCDPRPEEDCYE